LITSLGNFPACNKLQPICQKHNNFAAMNHLPEADEEEKQRRTSTSPYPFSATLPMTLLALILGSSLAMNVYFVATTIAGRGVSATIKDDALSVDVDSSRRSLNGEDCHQTPLALELELELDSESATASTANATSENIFPSSDNPGTITLTPAGGMVVSGSVKLTADINVEGLLPGNVGITLLSGAVLDCNGHSITGDPVDGNTGIKVAEGDGAKIMNCHVTKFGNSGVYLDFAKYVTIEHSSFNDNLGDGIYGLNSGGFLSVGLGTLEMNDVSVSNNGGLGMQIRGWGEGIRLNKIVANENGYEALKIWDWMSLTINTIQVKDVTALNNYQQQVYSGGGGTITAGNAKMISIEKATVVGGKEGISIYGDNDEGSTVELRDITVEDTVETGIYAYRPFSNYNIETSMSNVRVINSGGRGIYIEEGGNYVVTTLEDVLAKQSGSHGLEYDAAGKLVLKGENHFDENEGVGLLLFPGDATASVSHGKVTANGNQAGGIAAKTVSFEVEKRGSVVACGNNIFDVDTLYDSSTFTGRNYICDEVLGDSPICKPCRTGKSRSRK
jgi:hypothetical protein